SLRRLQKCPPPLRAAPDSGAPARPPSPSPGRSTGSGAAPTVLPRGGSRVHCLGGGGGGGGGGGAVSGGRGAGAGAGAGAASPRSWAARSGLCALTLRPVEAPRAESAVTRAARTTPPARPERGGGRGRGLRGGRRVRGAGCRAGRGAGSGVQPAHSGSPALPAEMRRCARPSLPCLPLHAPLRPGRWDCGGGGRRGPLPHPRAGRFGAARRGCLPGFTPPPRGKVASAESRTSVQIWWGEGCLPHQAPDPPEFRRVGEGC
uniref:Uncharacterized protein n=1 Tax=Canis lupus dingo TaxID=286419 RepID=A0A8C0KDY6_CANLU